MDASTLLLIKSNLTILNVVSAVISFFIGISPLFIDRDNLTKQKAPIWIELSAMAFLVFTVFMISLDYFANMPLHKREICLKYKNSYLTKLEFIEYYDRNKKVKVKDVGDSNYLVYNIKTKELYELPIKEDYKYQKEDCFKD
jgi:hypothetical protein